MTPEYSIPRPKPRAAFWLLSLLVIVGLAALCIAAYFAFSQIMPWYQALFAAILIEAGMIAESVALIQGNKIAVPGLVISLLVSGTYNYIQAERAGQLVGISDLWQLLTLSIGPLGALASLALAAGREAKEHDQRIKAWERERQVWLDGYQLRQERRQDRLERKKFERQLTGNFPQSEESSSEPSDWRKLPDEDKTLLAGMPTAEIVDRYSVSERTARNWRKAAQKMRSNGHHTEAQ